MLIHNIYGIINKTVYKYSSAILKNLMIFATVGKRSKPDYHSCQQKDAVNPSTDEVSPTRILRGILRDDMALEEHMRQEMG